MDRFLKAVRGGDAPSEEDVRVMDAAVRGGRASAPHLWPDRLRRIAGLSLQWLLESTGREDQVEVILERMDEGIAKLHVIQRSLALRREHPGPFAAFRYVRTGEVVMGGEVPMEDLLRRFPLALLSHNSLDER